MLKCVFGLWVALMNRKEEPTKFCECCGKGMQRKRYGQRLEDMSAFMRRRFCSLSCANKRTVLTKHGYSWRARRHLKAKCESCGYTRSLHAHHVDQDITNNQPENIQTLCKHCHNFWHTMAKRIGRMVAGKMPCLVSQRGWPLGHTDLKPLETGKFHPVLPKHLDS